MPQPTKSTPPSPASKYGKDSEFGQILDFIQSIVSDENLRHEFDIPHLVVVGRQNMAKTTLINRLIGRYLLPMRKGSSATQLQALTTHPILLNLRRDEIPQVKVEVPGTSMGGTVKEPTDEVVENFLHQVAKNLPKEPGTDISKTPVNVTLYGPGMSNLTLVDLPGVHFSNDNARMNVVTQDLVLDYIKKNKKSVIVIVSQVDDPTGDGAIDLVMRHASDYKSRTICVLTKPDKHNENDDIGRKVATNQSHFTLEPDHFILLKGKDGSDPEESKWDAETTRVMEKDWFKSHKQYQSLLHICGIDRLMDTMIKMLSVKMIEEIPLLIKSMNTRKEQLEKELQELKTTAVPDDEAGKGKLLSSLQSKLVQELKTLLFNNTTNIEGGETVRRLILRFNETIYKINPLDQRTDGEIRNLIRKLEGVTAPLGNNSENNQLLERLLYEPFNKESVSRQGSSSTLHRNQQLPSPIDELTVKCEKLVQDVEKQLKKIVLSAVQNTLQVFPDLQKSVEATVVPKIFLEKESETNKFIKQFIQMQKKSVDVVSLSVPLPQDIDASINSIIHSYEERQGRSLSHTGTFKIKEPEIFNHMRHLSNKLHSIELVQEVTSCNLHSTSNKEVKLSISTKKNVIRCFNHIKLNVIDTIPRCIQHFFITQLVESLERELEKTDLMEFLLEKEDVRRKRQQAQSTLESINHTLPQTDKITPMLLRIKQGRSAVNS